jgi:hypothetical protein
MIVGHNPGLQELTWRCCSEGPRRGLISRAQTNFPTATAAVFLIDAGRAASSTACSSRSAEASAYLQDPAARGVDGGRGAGRFEGSAVDHADGYIHFSTAAQAGETARRYFAGRPTSWCWRSRPTTSARR